LPDSFDQATRKHASAMPRDLETAPSETDSLLERGGREVKRFWEGFIDFAFQGNILQIAFGLMYVFFTLEGLPGLFLVF
jgi:hypothetical protein